MRAQKKRRKASNTEETLAGKSGKYFLVWSFRNVDRGSDGMTCLYRKYPYVTEK
jgi:predicted secreted protein